MRTVDMNKIAEDTQTSAGDMNKTAKDVHKAAGTMNKTTKDMNQTAKDMHATAGDTSRSVGSPLWLLTSQSSRTTQQLYPSNSIPVNAVVVKTDSGNVLALVGQQDSTFVILDANSIQIPTSHVTNDMPASKKCECLETDDLGLKTENLFVTDSSTNYPQKQPESQYYKVVAHRYCGFKRKPYILRKRVQLLLNRIYTCDVCSAEFPDYFDMKHHQKSHKTRKKYADKKRLTCNICGIFSAICKSALAAHVRKHTGERPFMCDICGASFRIMSSLHKHMVIHSGEKLFRCESCDMRFATANSLRVHVRVHTGYKPYICEYCGLCFAQSCNLLYHIKRHTGQKSSQCQICGQGFVDSYSLRKHRQMHAGEPLFKCKSCHVGFSKFSHLKHHSRTHTDVVKCRQTYRCDTCGANFTKFYLLKLHTRQHIAYHLN